LELGDRSFDSGDYPAAAEAYRVYLRDNPSAPNRDRALFHLALAHALPGSPLNDPPQAGALLRELRESYPQSPLRPQADLLLQLNEEVERLRLQLQDEDERLRSEIALREDRIGTLSQEVERLQQEEEMEKLRADLAQREEKIRQLTEELDKLKQIDMQRRPATPPR
jgi:molybdopterin converting factor small subunit